MTTHIQEEKREDKLQLVRHSYWKGFWASCGIVISALSTSYAIHHLCFLEDWMIDVLQAFSVVPGSAALFGVRGWDIQKHQNIRMSDKQSCRSSSTLQAKSHV